jgi:hypothetical protein
MDWTLPLLGAIIGGLLYLAHHNSRRLRRLTTMRHRHLTEMGRMLAEKAGHDPEVRALFERHIEEMREEIRRSR